MSETPAEYHVDGTPKHAETGVLSGALHVNDQAKIRPNPLAHFTPEQRLHHQELFLEHYRKNANMTAAAQAAGVTRQTVHDWRNADEEFAAQMLDASEAANDALREEIRRRGVDGWDERLVSAGKDMGTIHKYSDTLLIFHAKARMPEYRDKLQVNAVMNHMLPGSNGLASLLSRFLTVVEEQPQEAETTTATLLQEFVDDSSNGN
jgi:hypothetical protein